jgi:hypothetical protein
MASKTKYGVFEGELYYARLHTDNMDDSEYHERTSGQYNTVFVPKDDEEINKMVELGFPEESMGNKMIKPFDAAGGRKGMKLKRPNVHPSGIDDFGGAPSVTNLGTTSKTVHLAMALKPRSRFLSTARGQLPLSVLRR